MSFGNVGKDLLELGYPTHDELASVGLTGDDFWLRYVHPEEGKRLETVEEFSQRVLSHFHADYPTLKK